MVGNLLYLLFLVVLTAGLLWLAVRLWRSKKPIVRFGGGILASLLVLVFVLVTAATARALAVFYLPQHPPQLDMQVELTPERIERGQHIAASLCTGCHTINGDFPMSGGFNLSDDAGMPLGNLYPPNITPAGRVSTWTDGEIIQFFRYGRMPDGRRTVMPVINMSNLSDDDLYAVVAYLRSQEAVENDVPPLSASPLGLLMMGVNLLDVRFEAKTGAVSAPPVGPTADYGAYIVSYQDCTSCHGLNLDGVIQGPFPAGPNLRAVKGWTQEQFVAAMRTGIKPGGAAMVGAMPWKQIGRMDDVELAAVYEYLKTLQ